MATTFNMLRANDLIWSFVVNNYLLGKDPFPFDLLYWNSDSTRMPAAMHSFYLRNMYQENKLSQPGGITLTGVPIDLRKIDADLHSLDAGGPHRALEGDLCGDAALQGRCASCWRPPATSPASSIRRHAKKYNYWTNDKLPPDPEAWLKSATEHPGSWWPDWAKWAKNMAAAKVTARKPGDGKLKADRGRAGLLREAAASIAALPPP